MGNKYHIVYLPIAQKDLTEIIEYVQKDNPGAATGLLNQFDKIVSRLEDFPLMGQAPKDRRLQSLNYRIIIVSSYLVFYIVRENIVEIRRILHGKRKYNFLINPE